MRRSRKLLFASGVLAALLAAAALAPTTALALPADEADAPIPSEGSFSRQPGDEDAADVVPGSDETRHDPSTEPVVPSGPDGETVVTETPATPDSAQTDADDAPQDGSGDPVDDVTDGEPAASPQVSAPTPSLSTSASPQTLPSSQQTSAHEYTWLVTSEYGHGLQRYLLDHGTIAAAGLHDLGNGVWTYVRPDYSFVVRGRWVDSETGYVYLADNDGVLEAPGWVVSSAYGQGLQRYYVDPDAHACVPGVSEEGWTHLTTSSGYVLRGAATVDGRLYYADNDGLLATDGWVVTSAFGQGLQRYWFVDGSAAAPGRVYETGGWCYVRPEGFVVRGAYDTGHGKVYLADNDGNLPTETGWLITSRYGSGLQRYYIDAVSHAALTAHFEVGGSHYWGVANKGYVLRGKMRMGGGMLLADNDGRLAWDEGWLVTSLYDGSLQRYRIDASPGGGMMGARVGLFSLGGKQYYGREDTGYVVRGYYVNPSGVLYYGNNDGVLGRPPALYSDMASKAQGYSSATSWLILVDTRGNRVAVYTGSRGGWNATKEWRCTTGAPSTPTVKGEFTVTGKGYSFGTSTYTCYYYTQFYGDYLFHSVLYDAGTFNLQDGTIGANASHGCVRLELANAKWIYDNVPYGTKVVVY